MDNKKNKIDKEVVVISNKLGIPKIKFETVLIPNRKNKKTETKEILQTIDILPVEMEYFYNDNNNKTKPLNIGTTLCAFMNSYNDIINMFEQCKSSIEKNLEFSIIGILILIYKMRCNTMLDKNMSYIINMLFANILYKFLNDITYNRSQRIRTLKNELFVLEHSTKNNKKNANKEIYENIQLELKEIENTQYIKEQCLKFIDDTITEMGNIKKLVDASFSKQNNLFTGQNLKLPRAIIQYYKQENKDTICYTYNVARLSDFFNTSIYHMISDDKIIKQCPACKTYFIPNAKNEKYCYGEYGTTKIKCRGKHIGYFSIAGKYYERLCRVLRTVGDNESKEQLESEYKIIKSKVSQNGLTEMEQEQELMEFLRMFELEINKIHNTKYEYPKYEIQFKEYHDIN